MLELLSPSSSCPPRQARELEELAQIYVERGLPYDLARQVGMCMQGRRRRQGLPDPVVFRFPTFGPKIVSLPHEGIHVLLCRGRWRWCCRRRM